MAIASAHLDLHGSVQMENPTKARKATLRTIIAIATSSVVENRFAMRQFFLGIPATALIWIMLKDGSIRRETAARIA